jgi:hypothetical protein
MNHRVSAATVALLLCGILASSPLWSQENPTSFRVEEKTVDLGRVIAGRTISATFVFHNDGPTDVHIIRAKPS